MIYLFFITMGEAPRAESISLFFFSAVILQPRLPARNPQHWDEMGSFSTILLIHACVIHSESRPPPSLPPRFLHRLGGWVVFFSVKLYGGTLETTGFAWRCLVEVSNSALGSSKFEACERCEIRHWAGVCGVLWAGVTEVLDGPRAADDDAAKATRRDSNEVFCSSCEPRRQLCFRTRDGFGQWQH